MMRVAWFGPAPTDGGGVPYAAGQILRGLAGAGARVDAYVATGPEELADLSDVENLSLVTQPTRWEWDRWYSRSDITAVPTGQVARALAQRRLVRTLLARHARAPYDVVHQFSQFETAWSSRLDTALPPIVVHPEVHAAGELYWHRREDALSRRCEPRVARTAARAILMSRARVQRRQVPRMAGLIAPSSVFGGHLSRDYGIRPERIRVVPNPVDLVRFTPSPPSPRPERPLDVLFVARLSVRKGVDLVAALTHRIRDLEGRVRITVLGGHSHFSDYRPLLADLHPGTGTYGGEVSGGALAERYRRADAILQPSKYEPFALTVAEALASGLVVAASDEVGAIEEVSDAVHVRFHADDLDDLERGFRVLVERLEADPDRRASALARAEAERLFGLEPVGRRLLTALGELARRGD